MQLVPSVSGAGQIEFYSPTGAALDALMPGPTDENRAVCASFTPARCNHAHLKRATAGRGKTYASGCPFITPDVQRTLTHVAH